MNMTETAALREREMRDDLVRGRSKRPCWYELSFRHMGEGRKLLLRIHERSARAINTLHDNELIERWSNRFEFDGFHGVFGADIGYGGVLRYVGPAADSFIAYEIPIPKDYRDGIAVYASLAIAFAALNAAEPVVPKGPPQLMAISCGITEGTNTCSFEGTFHGELADHLRFWDGLTPQERHEMVHAMQEVSGKASHAFFTARNDSGGLLVRVGDPGHNGFGLRPRKWPEPGEGYDFVTDNVRHPRQALILLAALGALSWKVHRDIFNL